MEKQNTETGILKKPTDKRNTGSNIRTSTVPKGPHPKLGMTGGRKPAANPSATVASAPNAAVGLPRTRNVLPNYWQDKPTQDGAQA